MKKSNQKKQRPFSASAKPSPVKPSPAGSTRKLNSELESLVNTEHVVTIERMVVGGDGLARLQHQNNSLVIFVSFSAPEDELRVRITSADKNFLRAEIINILKPSPHRATPRCEYFGACGGCNWQHLSSAQQLKQKEQILQDLLFKFLPEKSYSLSASVESDLLYNYRNRIQLKHHDKRVGYFKRGSHEIVEIQHCELAEVQISSSIKMISSKLRPSAELKKFEIRINQNLEIESYPIGEDGEGLSFSQVNNSVNEKLVRTAVEIAREINPEFITELYAGAGNFTFPLAQALPGARIETVELNGKLTSHAQKEILSNSYQKRIFAFTSDCEAFVRRRPLSKQLLLLDPPRVGCSDEVLQKIVVSRPRDILYISCHPAFLARDLKKLMSAQPDYSLKRVQIFNMFPQTDHFETLVHLQIC